MNEPVTRRIDAPDDAAARRRALDVTQSFLVQAPAGSGKTELLIQRYLALLAHVDRPERVVAMTFTRKAAAEMLGRIVEALRDAGADVAAPTEHRARTLALARAVLSQDARFGWELVAHPARLRVMTIDAFCAALARQAPLATRFGATPRFEEHAHPLYLRAARAALDDAGTDDAPWQRLLTHLDNDAGRAVALVADLLAKRDQWLKSHGGRGSRRLSRRARVGARRRDGRRARRDPSGAARGRRGKSRGAASATPREISARIRTRLRSLRISSRARRAGGCPCPHSPRWPSGRRWRNGFC